MKLTPTQLKQRLKKIKLLINDVDGVLTDGGVYLNDNGMEGKRFNVLDGAGCALARLGGLQTAWVTARQSKLLARRAQECRISFLLQNQKKKLPALQQLLTQTGLATNEAAYIGDDLVDVPVMEQVGIAIAVPNAIAEVKRAAHFITKRPGGYGAVREVIELILKAQHQWQSAVHRFQGRDETTTQK